MLDRKKDDRAKNGKFRPTKFEVSRTGGLASSGRFLVVGVEGYRFSVVFSVTPFKIPCANANTLRKWFVLSVQ